MRFTIVILTALLCLTAQAQRSTEDSDEAIMAAAEKLVGEGKTLKTEEATAETEAKVGAKAADPSPDSVLEPKPESEIPLFAKSEKVTKSESSLVWRMLASLALVGVVGGALLYATRRWNWKKNKGGEKARIEIMHQYQLGPRKSLALVRVAGEAILIGCTDHNISMLKTVTLIDDELAGVMNKDFNGFLEDEFQMEEVRNVMGKPRGGREYLNEA